MEESLHDYSRREVHEALVRVQHRLHPHARQRYLRHPRLRCGVLRLLHQEINLRGHREDDHQRVFHRLSVVILEPEPRCPDLQLVPAILAPEHAEHRRIALAALARSAFARILLRPARPHPPALTPRPVPPVPPPALAPQLPERVPRVVAIIRTGDVAIDRLERPGFHPHLQLELATRGVLTDRRAVDAPQPLAALQCG